MEKEEVKGLSEEELTSRIASLMQSMKSADAEEIERVRSIVKKNVSFFERSAFAAYLLMISASKPVSSRPEKKRERQERAERPERTERAEKAEKQDTQKEAETPKSEKVIPEGAKTIYIDVGKMKHLYPKDLSKRLQAELGITRDDIYMIRIHDKYSFVTMSEENCVKAIEKVSGMDINGRTASVSFAEKKNGAKDSAE